MGLRGDFERVAQARDLHRDEVLHHLAGALDGVLALHHDVEIQVVDQADQQVGQRLVRAEHRREPRHAVGFVPRVLKLASLTRPRTRSFSGSNLAPAGSLASCFSARRAAAAKRSSSSARMPGDAGERAGGEQAGHQVGLGADLDHRLHHLQALHQGAHRDVAALPDVLGGGHDLEIAVVDDRRELVADLVVGPVQRS